MDRGRLDEWLKSPHRTFRWNDGADSERYEGVTTTEEGLRWFRWSHVFADGSGEGEHDVASQSYEEFLASGPLREMPAKVEDELRAWMKAHR